ncbi:MAG: DNA translocase FtsK 4TM domain-containing protein [Deltaproteobacteria bacterium]|nr:DNA translocase FtsK 4TM domain-containing protein [Deltaproteobacteria bacterium]
MAKDKKKTDPNLFATYLKKEISAVAWLALSAFFFIILATYNSNDPSFNNNLNPEKIVNAGGVIGSHISDLLLQVFGLCSVLFPVAFLSMGIKLLRLKDIEVRFHKIAAFGVLIFSLCGLISLRFGSLDLWGRQVKEAGGAFGKMLAGVLTHYLNPMGAFLLLFVIFLASLLITIRFSLLWCLKMARERLPQMMASRKERKEEKKAEKAAARERKKEEREKPGEEESRPLIATLDTAPEKAEATPNRKKAKEEKKPRRLEILETSGDYRFPSFSLLEHEQPATPPQDSATLAENARLLERKLLDFGVQGKVVEVKPGPVVTMYEFLPAPGIKVNKIAGLQDDLTMALRALSIRIVAPIPGRGVVGIEIPNKDRETVYLKEILESDEFQNAESGLPLALGKDIFGHTIVAELAHMPHLLVAGATGSGKSVSINTMVLSLLYRATPDDVRMIMIDPKMLELSIYEGIPHLLLPVVTDPKKAALSLAWAVREMERRYRLMADKAVRNIEGYNRKIAREEANEPPLPEPPIPPETDEILGDQEEEPFLSMDEAEVLEHGHLPYIVIMVDELADLMMVAGREIEESITRLAQMARAAGIHLILATQRPSVDVITGLIKANFPTRISFKVFARTDSRTILDSMGAETLLGKGDMLYLPPGTGVLKRVHGAFVSETEVERVVDFLRHQGEPEYDAKILEAYAGGRDNGGDEDDEYDEKWDEALAIVSETRQASISMLQRRLRVGYNRAARMIEQMEKEGIIGPSDGTSKPRDVFINRIDN